MTGALNPSGLCQCGCGEPAPISTANCRSRGYVKGEHFRFVRGHISRGRCKPNRWVEQDRGYETPCWVWQLAIFKATGYGQVHHNGQPTVAHRVVYEQHKGPIPPGLTLDHLCRVRACVNPHHLEPVTLRENIRRAPGKLNPKLAKTIRASDEPAKVWAARLGVSLSCIYGVREGRTWSEEAEVAVDQLVRRILEDAA